MAVATSGFPFDTKVTVYPPGEGMGGTPEAGPIWGGWTWKDRIDWQLQHTGLYTIVVEGGAGTYNISFLKIPCAVNFPADPDGGSILSGETLSETINVASDMARDSILIMTNRSSGDELTRAIFLE